MSFGSVAIGSLVDQTFTVLNTSTTSLTSTASVGGPYSILSGRSFSLTAGASQAVTVRFRPTATGTFAGNVNFTAGGDTVSRALSGSGTNGTPVTVAVAKGGSGTGHGHQHPAPGIGCGATCLQIRRPPGAHCSHRLPSAGSTFAGCSGACSGTGSCAVTVAFGDGTTASAGHVRGPSVQLRMPYHPSGAATTGFIASSRSTRRARPAADQACNAVPIPARPTASAPVTLSLTKNGAGSGTVISTPGGIDCGTTCSQTLHTRLQRRNRGAARHRLGVIASAPDALSPQRSRQRLHLHRVVQRGGSNQRHPVVQCGPGPGSPLSGRMTSIRAS